MAVHVIMEKITSSGRLDGRQVLTVDSKTDITHCLTSISEIEEQLSIGGSFVMPDFDFSVDNIDNAEYFPNYPACRNFKDYYDTYIRDGAYRVHVDVRYITATSNKSVFYGSLNSVIPAINYKTQELSFTATHIMKSGMNDISVERLIAKIGQYTGAPVDHGSTAMLYVTGLLHLMDFGVGQSSQWDSFEVFSAEAVKYLMADTVIQMPANNVREYTSSIEFLGDALRAFSAFYTWENNLFRFHDIKNLWSVNAAVAIDTVLTDISKSEPWEESASDVVIEVAGNNYSGYDIVDNDTTGRRPFTTGNTPTYRAVSKKLRGPGGKLSDSHVIDAPMMNYFYAPAAFAPPFHPGDRAYTRYASGYVSALYFMVDMIWLHNYDFWVNHKVKLDCEVDGLDYYYGRKYTIIGKEYKCIQTTKNLENETTKLKLVSAEL